MIGKWQSTAQTLKPMLLTCSFSGTQLWSTGAGIAFEEFSHCTTEFWRSQNRGKWSSYKLFLQYENSRVEEISVPPEVSFLQRTGMHLCCQLSMREWCLLIKSHTGGTFTSFSEARTGSHRDTLERGALQAVEIFARLCREQNFDECQWKYRIFVLFSVFRRKHFLFYFFRSAQSTMGKAVDAFSKYFLCLKCETCSGTPAAFAFTPFPGNSGLTIPQGFRVFRYAPLQGGSFLSQCLCNWGPHRTDGTLTAWPRALWGRYREVRRAWGLELIYTSQWGHTNHLLRTHWEEQLGLSVEGSSSLNLPLRFFCIILKTTL